MWQYLGGRVIKKIMIFSATIIIVGFLITSVSIADNCKDGYAMLDRAFEDPPDEMTVQYIEMAIQDCPGNEALYRRIGRYYEQWYKKELNPRKQAEFKAFAQDYYRKAMENADNARAKKIKVHLSQLEDSDEFNEVAFRALRPSKQGKTGSGLKLDVHFAHDSCKLSNSVQQHLDILGVALSDLKTTIVSLEGHTDLAGTAEYNKVLSLKRAQTVRKYIVENYSISPDRIRVSGYGFDRLADRKNPYSITNRRVEVIKLSE